MGFKVWGFRVEFGGFGLQGLGFPGLVWRVWAPRFKVSGFSSESLDSKVWGFRVELGGFRLQGSEFRLQY